VFHNYIYQTKSLISQKFFIQQNTTEFYDKKDKKQEFKKRKNK